MQHPTNSLTTAPRTATSALALLGHDPEELVDTKAVAHRTKTSASFWNKRRLLGGDDTPEFIKLGAAVKYRWGTVVDWLNRQRRSSTSDRGTTRAA